MRDTSERKYSRKGYIAYQCSVLTDLINNGKITLAWRVIDSLLPEFETDIHLMKRKARLLILERKYEEALQALEFFDEEETFMMLAAIYIKLNDDEKLYHIYWEYFYDDYPVDSKLAYKYRVLRNYLRKRYEENYSPQLHKMSYREQQAVSYDYTKVINQIISCHTSSGESIIYGEVFADYIDIEELFSKAKASIEENMDKSFLNGYREFYFFYYPECGDVNGVKTNYFIAEVNYNTSEIITMAPVHHLKNAPIIDLKSLEGSKLAKVPNGLERFNERYHN